MDRPLIVAHTGGLAVHVWPGATSAAPVVVAVHGITANGLCWARVADALAGRVTLVAPDLRGRAGSRDAPRPYGIHRHAADLVDVLDALEVPAAVLLGHSMGGYVAALAAAKHPDRARAAVLVDGGLGVPAPPDVDVDAVLAAVIGPAIHRLDMTFADRDAYRRYWQAHPALAGHWSPAVDEYTQYDLVGDGPYRSSCVKDAVRDDSTEVLLDPEVLGAVHELAVPAEFLYAERGFLDDDRPLYDAQRLAGLRVPAARVPGTNHYSIILADPGAAAVAEAVLRHATGRESR